MADRKWGSGQWLLAGLLLSTAAVAQNDKIGQAIDAAQAANRAAAASQSRVSSTDGSTQQMLERYRQASWQAQQLSVYAKQLEQLLSAQEAEKISLQQQLQEIDRTERELAPLMLRMLDSLDKFVTLDLPFLKQERRERIANLKRLMTDPEAPVAERYRRLLEAYQIEIDYGRSLGVERSVVDEREVDVLRVGRAALFYLTLDGDSAGRWDAKAKKWEELDSGYRKSIRQGLRIAREVTAPDLVTLPMPVAAGAAK